MQNKNLQKTIDNMPCRTEHLKTIEQIHDMGGSERLKMTRAFIYGTMIGGKDERGMERNKRI